MTWRTLAVMTLMLASLSGCATAPTSEFCLVVSPIRPSVQDQMTDGTKRQILAHNEYGARACGWRP